LLQVEITIMWSSYIYTAVPTNTCRWHQQLHTILYCVCDPTDVKIHWSICLYGCK